VPPEILAVAETRGSKQQGHGPKPWKPAPLPLCARGRSP